MQTRHTLEETLREELMRVVGPDVNALPGIDHDTGNEELALGIARLRELPDAIGFQEMMRRLQGTAPQ